jgi:O-antigen/teichoic acid export membrane protein
MSAEISIPRDELTRGSLLARSTIWNLAGQILPMGAAVFAIPPVLRSIGLERFGVLTLGWVIVGYFSLFDLGLGRALTKIVADKLAARDEHDLFALIWTSSLLMFLLGLFAGLVMFALAPWLVNHVLNVPESLKVETLYALYLLAVSVPIVTSTSGFRGVLEAVQRFDIVNQIRIPMGISVFLGPLLVVPFSKSLVWIFAFLVAGRLLAWIAYIIACLATIPGLGRSITLDLPGLRSVLKFGGWITAGNLIVPVMVYVDRFVIGSLLSLSAVAFYTTPFELVTKLLTIPGAVAGVMFPAFAATYVQDRSRTGFLMQRGVKYVFITLFPVILMMIAFAPEGLKFWVGTAFAQQSTLVLRYLAAGVFVNCLAQIPLSLVQGTGRPDIVAKLQALELPLYLAATYWMTKHYGLSGAAIAWSARVSLDALLLFVVAYGLLPHTRGFGRRMALSVTGALTVFYFATVTSFVGVRILLIVFFLLSTAAAAWFWALVEDERLLIRGLLLGRQKTAV